MNNARLLADPRTVAVVTGQQAGLFGGPLFTLLKALTALKLAEQVARDHNVPAVAIFWIDAEDHDWEEVRSCAVFDADLTPRSVSLPSRPGVDPAPVATVKLDDSVRIAIDELEQILPATEFRPSVIAALQRAYAPGTGMAESFGRWMEHVLGDRGLIVFESSDPASKPLASQVFTRELSMPGQTGRLSAIAGSDLTARGYHAQVHQHDDGVALFHLDGGRRAIRQQDGGFLVGDQRYPGRGAAAAGHRAAGRLQPERPAASGGAGHALPDGLLRRRTERARLSRSAARRLRALRRADAAHVSARHSPPSSTHQRCASSRSTSCRSKRCRRRTRRP